MYFKDEKKDTNIDDEFENNNLLSKILRFISSYKLYFFIGIAIILIIIMYFIFANREVTNYLVINGEQNITLYQGADYIEPGYLAYNSKKDDLTNDVTITSTLDTSKIGEYEITYTLGNITETRKITIVEKPKEYTYIYLKSVNNDINLYIKKGEEYIEPGYQVFSSTGFDLTNQVKITGNVDTNKAGTYKLIYSVVDSNNVTISVSRTIIVMDSEINLSLNPDTPTNKTVTINIGVIDNYFDYLILPNSTKITDKTYSYNVFENGTYTFKVYNKKGDYKESSIDVKNIDKIKPTGSCSGTYGNGQSIINISAKDESGIEKYYINGKSYTSSKITITKELTTANITIYDKAGNTQDISCNLQKTTSKPSSSKPHIDKPITSDKSITFNYEYKKEDGYIPYALYTPSTSKQTNNKIPLIIFLHGIGEVSSGEQELKDNGMPDAMNNWKLEGFNAYVLCPHLTGKYAHNWHNETTRERLNYLTEKIIDDKNIDTSKIIITGHSLGGQGALYMAAKNDYYYKMVVYSGYYPQTPINGIKIPAKGYIGGSGEDEDSIIHMEKFFSPVFGEENLITVKTGHGNVPQVALNLDENKDNKSDLIEWMLS